MPGQRQNAGSAPASLWKRRSFSMPSGLGINVLKPNSSDHQADHDGHAKHVDANGYESAGSNIVDSPVNFGLGRPLSRNNEGSSASSVFYTFTHKHEKRRNWFQNVGEAAKSISTLSENLSALSRYIGNQTPEVLGQVLSSSTAVHDVADRIHRTCEKDVTEALGAVTSACTALSDLIRDQRVNQAIESGNLILQTLNRIFIIFQYFLILIVILVVIGTITVILSKTSLAA